MLKSKRKACHARPLGQLKLLKDTLLGYIFKHHEQGIVVNTFLLVVKALSLSPEFNAEHFIARYSAVKRIEKAHSLVYCMGTHKMHTSPFFSSEHNLFDSKIFMRTERN
jgi:hypothetical protein